MKKVEPYRQTSKNSIYQEHRYPLPQKYLPRASTPNSTANLEKVSFTGGRPLSVISRVSKSRYTNYRYR